MIAAIVVLLILALGELDSSRAGSDDHSNVFAFGFGKSFEILPGVFGGFVGREESHRHSALHAVFVFL